MKVLNARSPSFWVHSLLCNMASTGYWREANGNHFSHLYHRPWNIRRNARHMEWAEPCTFKDILRLTHTVR